MHYTAKALHHIWSLLWSNSSWSISASSLLQYSEHYIYHLASHTLFSCFNCDLRVTTPTNFLMFFWVNDSTCWLSFATLPRLHRLAAIQRRISETSGDLRNVINSASTLRDKLSTHADKIDRVDVISQSSSKLHWNTAGAEEYVADGGGGDYSHRRPERGWLFRKAPGAFARRCQHSHFFGSTLFHYRHYSKRWCLIHQTWVFWWHDII